MKVLIDLHPVHFLSLYLGAFTDDQACLVLIFPKSESPQVTIDWCNPATPNLNPSTTLTSHQVSPSLRNPVQVKKVDALIHERCVFVVISPFVTIRRHVWNAQPVPYALRPLSVMLITFLDFLIPSQRPEFSIPYAPVHLMHVGFNSSTGEFTAMPKE